MFLAQFFNTGFLILLVNANLEETLPELGGIFNGLFNDYTPEWYNSVGYVIVQTMILNAFMPMVTCFINNSIRWYL